MRQNSSISDEIQGNKAGMMISTNAELDINNHRTPALTTGYLTNLHDK